MKYNYRKNVEKYKIKFYEKQHQKGLARFIELDIKQLGMLLFQHMKMNVHDGDVLILIIFCAQGINKRFQRLESHVVTLARSVAHLSSEMRTQHLMIQVCELLHALVIYVVKFAFQWTGHIIFTLIRWLSNME